MKIKNVTFGSAVKFRGKTDFFVQTSNEVEILFDKGIVWLRELTGRTDVACVFTSNVKYFTPMNEPVAEDLVPEVEAEALIAVTPTIKGRPGRKPKIVNE